jgi:peptidoglycan-N-acetylglucosamine deacetylase
MATITMPNGILEDNRLGERMGIMGVLVLGLLLGLLVLAYVYAEVVHRWMGVGSLAWGSRKEPKIALTIDDGPSEHTEAILDLLEQHKVKATFFILGSQAERYPDYLEKIRAAGHQTESHGQIHKPAVMMLPWQEARSMQLPGKLYRPPHGIHSPFTRLLALARGQQVAIWDVESRDWTAEPVQALAERIVFWCRPGSVILLHDNAAFPQSVDILRSILPQLKTLGYQPVRLDEMDIKPLSWREGLMRASQGEHEGFFTKHKVQRLGLGPFDYLSVAQLPFPGPAQPGLAVGDTTLELHLDSVRTPAMGQMQILRETQKAFRLLADRLEDMPEVKGVWAMAYAATALKVFGFKLAGVTWQQRLVGGLASAWFLWLYTGELPKRSLPAAQLGYMTREAFLEKWKSQKKPSS